VNISYEFIRNSVRGRTRDTNPLIQNQRFLNFTLRYKANGTGRTNTTDGYEVRTDLKLARGRQRQRKPVSTSSIFEARGGYVAAR